MEVPSGRGHQVQ